MSPDVIKVYPGNRVVGGHQSSAVAGLLCLEPEGLRGDRAQRRFPGPSLERLAGRVLRAAAAFARAGGVGVRLAHEALPQQVDKPRRAGGSERLLRRWRTQADCTDDAAVAR